MGGWILDGWILDGWIRSLMDKTDHGWKNVCNLNRKIGVAGWSWCQELPIYFW